MVVKPSTRVRFKCYVDKEDQAIKSGLKLRKHLEIAPVRVMRSDQNCVFKLAAPTPSELMDKCSFTF